jgi:fructokinase
MRRARIVSFGEALIDFLVQPQASSDSPRAFLQFAGGAAANVAVAIARLGGSAQFVGMLGADLFGTFLLQSLRAAGVGTDFVLRTDRARTALAFVTLDEEGERSFSFYRPPSADLLFRSTDFAPECFEGASAFHVCSNSLTEDPITQATIFGMEHAREAGALVSMDVNLRLALWPPGMDPLPRIWEALHRADLVKLTRAELEHLADSRQGGEQAVLARLWGGRTQVVTVTDGAAPICWYTREHHGEVPAFPIKAVDTTAAGDAFVGGFLLRLAQQGIERARLIDFLKNPTELSCALRFAAAVGALAATRKGSFHAMPRLAEVEDLLDRAS